MWQLIGIVILLSNPLDAPTPIVTQYVFESEQACYAHVESGNNLSAVSSLELGLPYLPGKTVKQIYRLYKNKFSIQFIRCEQEETES